jgi:TP901 family phage tail tape measure protein
MSLKIDRLQLEIIINNDQARKSLRHLEDEAKQLKKEMKKLPEGSAEWDKLNDRLKQNKLRHDKIIESLGIEKLTIKELAQRQKELNRIMQNLDPTTAAYKKLETQLVAIKNRQAQLRGSATKTNASLKTLASNFRNTFAKITAGVFALTGVFYAFKGWVNKLVGFEDQLSNVMKTTGLTRNAVRELTNEFKYLKTRTSREELMLLAEEAGRLGKKSKQDVLDFVEVANQLKTALGDDLGDNAQEAVREVGKLTSIYKVGEKYGLGFKDSMLKIGSAINEVSANSNAQAPYLIETLKRMGGLADQAGIMAQDIIGYGSALDQLGQRTEMSTTALNKVILNMFTDTSTYAEIAKMDLEEFTNLLNTDANEAFLKVLKGLNGNNDGLTIMGGKLQDLGLDGSRAVQVLAALAGNIDMITDAQDLANTALIEGTSLTEEYNIKNNNFAGSVSKMGIAWDRFVISVSESDGLLKSGFDSMSRFINWITEITVDDEKNLEKFRKNKNEFYDMSAVNAMKLAALATELTKKQHELRGKDKASIDDWINVYSERLKDLEGNDSKYADNKRLLYNRQIHDLRGFVWEQDEILSGDGGKGGKKPEKEISNLIKLEKDLADLKTAHKLINENDKQAINASKKTITDLESRINKLSYSYKEFGKAKKKAFDPTKLDSPDTYDAEYLQMKADTLKKYREEDIEEIVKNYDTQTNLNQTAHQNALTALGSDQEARKALDEQFKQDEKQRALLHLESLTALLNEQLATGGLDSMSIEQAMLSDEEKESLSLKIADLQLLIATLKAEIAGEETTDPDQKGAISKFLFGADWSSMEIEDKIKAVGQLAISTFSDINKIISNSENQQLENFKKKTNEKKEALNKQLNSAEISYDQYTARTAFLDDELDKKRRKIEHDQAVRTKAIGIMNAIINTAVAITSVAPVVPLMILAGVLGAIQIGIIATEPVPALAEGNYQQILASDGKKYRARKTTNKHKSGLFNEPTYVPGFGVFGETADPELVFNPEDSSKIMNSPALIDAINGTIGVNAFANGNAREIIKENSTVEKTFTDPLMLEILEKLNNKLDQPFKGYIVPDEDSIRNLDKVQTDYNDFQKRVG